MSASPIFQNPHLDGRSFTIQGTSTGILLLHGFTATTVEVRPLGEYLHSKGFTIAAPLLPGHGTRPEDLIGVRWMDWVRCVDEAYSNLQKTCSQIFVAGESMGGLLGLYLASIHPEIKGILLFAPALHIPGIWKAGWISPFIKIMRKRYIADSDDELSGQLPWQGYNVLTLPSLRQLRQLQKEINHRLPQIKQPALIFQGKQDRTVDPQGAFFIHGRIGSEDKALVWLQNSGHCVLLDIERELVMAQVFDFIIEHLAPPQ
jgi:carboxylesterase